MGTKGHVKTYVYNPDVPERGTHPTEKQYHEPSTYAGVMDHHHTEVIFLLRRIARAESLLTLEGFREEKLSLLAVGAQLLKLAEVHPSRYNMVFRATKEALSNSLTELETQYRKRGIVLQEEKRRALHSPHVVKPGDSFAQRLARKIIQECKSLRSTEEQKEYIPRSIHQTSPKRFEAPESTIPIESLIEEIQEGEA